MRAIRSERQMMATMAYVALIRPGWFMRGGRGLPLVDLRDACGPQRRGAADPWSVDSE